MVMGVLLIRTSAIIGQVLRRSTNYIIIQDMPKEGEVSDLVFKFVQSALNSLPQ